MASSLFGSFFLTKEGQSIPREGSEDAGITWDSKGAF